MKVGIVCPYSWDVPGGVQFHVRDLAEVLLARGHDVSVLAPADDDTPLPPYVVPAGRAVPVPYNGSVARVNFGPLSAARVRRWLREGGFDVLHMHEPATPVAVAAGVLGGDRRRSSPPSTPSNLRSRAMIAAYPILEPALEKISARIAVSEDARRTLVEHLGGDAVLIPNGVFVDRFAAAPRRSRRGGATAGRSASSAASTSRARACRRCSPRSTEVVAARARASGCWWPAAATPRRRVEDLPPGGPRARSPSSAWSSEAGQGPAAAHRRRLRGAQPRRRELRHRPGRGDVRRRAGAGLRPRRVPPGARRRPGRRAVPDRRRRGARRGRCSTCSATPPAAGAAVAPPASAWVRRYDWSTVGDELIAVYETVAAGSGAVGEDVGAALAGPAAR